MPVAGSGGTRGEGNAPAARTDNKEGELGPDRHQVLIALRGRPVGRTRLRRFSAAPTSSRRGGDTAPLVRFIGAAEDAARPPKPPRNSYCGRGEGIDCNVSRRHRRAGLLDPPRRRSQRRPGLGAAGDRMRGRRRLGLLGAPFRAVRLVGDLVDRLGLGRLPAAPPRRALKVHHVGVLNADRVLVRRRCASEETRRRRGRRSRSAMES